MSRTLPVTFADFQILFKYAQQHHATKEEPIPKMQEENIDKVKSCLETPFQTFGGRYLYPGFYLKAAMLFYLFNKNHSLVNGNKRMACFVLGYFCHINKHVLSFHWETFYDLALEVTNSDPIEKEQVVLALVDVFKKFIPKRSST